MAAETVRILAVEALPAYRVRLALTDGRYVEHGWATLVGDVDGPMTAPLRDPGFFAQVRLDPELGTLVWPNGYDICPDILTAVGN